MEANDDKRKIEELTLKSSTNPWTTQEKERSEVGKERKESEGKQCRRIREKRCREDEVEEEDLSRDAGTIADSLEGSIKVFFRGRKRQKTLLSLSLSLWSRSLSGS